MTELIERTRYRIGAAVAPHTGRHTRGASRVRPYASQVPYTPAPKAAPVPTRAPVVRPYLTAAERQQRTDRDRLGLAVLQDIARQTEVTS